MIIDKKKEIICYCKISLRGYEAALVLQTNGWENVKVMEGGIMVWPYNEGKIEMDTSIKLIHLS